MSSKLHEIRDPIHAFVRLDSDERRVLDSAPCQRLREIHQLALTYLIYPGATHRRFEHSLGVMELAGRIYDVVTNPENLYDDSVRRVVPNPQSFDYGYWKRVLRMAALLHDVGHLPFSHAAEKELLPAGWNHERLTYDLVMSDYLAPTLRQIKVDPEHVAKIAVGPAKHPAKAEYTEWETILSEIITGDAFGADRMDYLLRDSLHAGVSYGRFDHFRLLDTLRILPRSREDSKEPSLGIVRGGLESAESLLWARYFMYTQLYFHPVRRIYDKHLKEFLQAWLPDGRLSTRVEDHLRVTDSDVLSAIRSCDGDEAKSGHDYARRIARREHFRLVYEMNPADQEVNPNSVDLVEKALNEKFGADHVRRDTYIPEVEGVDFPIYTRDGRILSSLSMSKTLQRVPDFAVDCLYVDPQIRNEAESWLAERRDQIISGNNKAGNSK